MNLDRAEIKKTAVQLAKYGAIGVMNTVITLVTFYLLNTWVGVPYGAANITGYVLGVVNSFLWNRSWVFNSHDSLARQALLFGCGFAVCWVLQGLVSLLLLEGLGWKHLADDVIPFFPMKNAGQNIVMVVSMVVYTVANYAYNRTVTFRQKDDTGK